MVSGRIAVLCPTKGRVALAIKAYDSMIATSELADMVWCVEKSDAAEYALESARPRLGVFVSEGGAPVPTINAAASATVGYEAYGLMVDDATFVTPGWDRWMLDRIAGFPKSIGVVSPWHNGGPWCNFPYVSRQWFDTLGWLACPTTMQFCWDGVLEMLGESTSIAHAKREEFAIDHEMLAGADRSERLISDGTQFLEWFMYARRADIAKLREAVGAK